MRRRTITLVIVGLVLALFVLPAAAEIALTADEPEEVEYELVTGYDAATHVAAFAVAPVPADEDPPNECDPSGIIGSETDGEVSFDGEVDGCTLVLIEGPNGQVNHGQYVSNMIHAVKGEHDKGMHGPFGQWVKGLAHFDGVENFKPEKGDDLEPLEAAELNDEGEKKGKPDHANGNSKKAKKNK